jgi:hypothetical protein
VTDAVIATLALEFATQHFGTPESLQAVTDIFHGPWNFILWLLRRAENMTFQDKFRVVKLVFLVLSEPSLRAASAVICRTLRLLPSFARWFGALFEGPLEEMREQSYALIKMLWELSGTSMGSTCPSWRALTTSCRRRPV